VVLDSKIKRGEVFLVNLDPTLGGEIKKTRPCLIVSPDELNEALRTYIVAPLTTGGACLSIPSTLPISGQRGFCSPGSDPSSRPGTTRPSSGSTFITYPQPGSGRSSGNVRPLRGDKMGTDTIFRP
jgi:hypothetical protein